MRRTLAMSLASTISLEFSKSNARGRSDLRSPDDAWTSQAHDSLGIRQDRRALSAAPSPFRKNGHSNLAATGLCRSGFRKQIDDIGWPRANLCIDNIKIRGTQVLGGTGDRQAPIFCQESEGGIRRRMRRQPGGESGRHWCLGMEPSDRAAGTYGARFGCVNRLSSQPWTVDVIQAGLLFGE